MDRRRRPLARPGARGGGAAAADRRHAGGADRDARARRRRGAARVRRAAGDVGEVAVVEIANESPAPFVVALVVRGATSRSTSTGASVWADGRSAIRTPRPPSRWAASVDGSTEDTVASGARFRRTVRPPSGPRRAPRRRVPVPGRPPHHVACRREPGNAGDRRGRSRRTARRGGGGARVAGPARPWPAGRAARRTAAARRRHRPRRDGAGRPGVAGRSRGGRGARGLGPRRRGRGRRGAGSPAAPGDASRRREPGRGDVDRGPGACGTIPTRSCSRRCGRARARARRRRCRCSPTGRSEWFGQPIDVRDAPTRRGPVSCSVRWHGERPALLWEGPADTTFTAPGLDPAWSSGERARRGAPRGASLNWSRPTTADRRSDVGEPEREQLPRSERGAPRRSRRAPCR